MKNKVWMLACLLSLALAMPSFAQQGNTHQRLLSPETSAQIERMVLNKEKEFKQQKKVDQDALYKAEELLQQDKDANNGYPKHSLEYYYQQVKQNNGNQAGVCVRCGEEVRPGQHCAATDYTSLCTETEKTPFNHKNQSNPYFKGGDPHNPDNYEKCFRCGQPITDERLNDKCSADCDVRCTPASNTDTSKYTCYRCGKSFRAGQHCEATGYTSLCANSKAQEKALAEEAAKRAKKELNDAVCPKCGHQYTPDERYHHIAHQCNAD